MRKLLIVASMCLGTSLSAQQPDLLESSSQFSAVNVTYEQVTYLDKTAIKVMPTAVGTEAKFLRVDLADFGDGVIEIEIAGKRAANAGAGARGFVGVVFRVKSDNSAYECFYIRPTNGRAEDQLRRNHSVQYTSFPDFPWHRLRQETPGKYETYADLVEGAWTHLKIEVTGEKARLYVGGADQPTLLVNDLKHGADHAGKIGLWVGPGTEGYFAGLKVSE